MTRDGLWLKLLAAAALLLVGYWLVTTTEWVEVDVPAELRGEAATNPYYTASRLLRKLGVRVERRDNLDQLPPPHATLVLDSLHWALFPERVARLRQWVEHGGHLVAPPHLLHDDNFAAWAPIELLERPKPKVRPAKDEDDDDDGEAAAAPPAPASSPAAEATSPLALRRSKGRCAVRHEPESVPATYADGGRDFKVCGFAGALLKSKGTPPLWSLDGPQGPESMRVALGRGRLTALLLDEVLDNRDALEGDNALVMVAALSVHAGDEVWFVSDEKREPLLPWVWHQGWIAVVLGALALAAALWRNGMRFGPLAARPPEGRRSVGEQIRGTAEFVWHRGAGALHAAQLRALDEAARRRVRGYDKLDRAAKAAALARATGLEAEALGRGLDTRVNRPRHAWPATLALLETARRRIAALPPSSSSSASSR